MQHNNTHSTNGERATVLVVEDDEMTIELMQAMLSTRYTVATARNETQAKKVLSERTIDIILVDISLVGSKNGLEITQQVKSDERLKHIPVIAVTAHAYMRDKKNALEAGCDYYFAKPINHYQLMNKMDELLAKANVRL